MKIKYFVSFYDTTPPQFYNDVVTWDKIDDENDIEELESHLSYKWFGQERELKIINLQKL